MKVLKKIGSILWLVIKCIGYLIFALSMIWLITGFFDGLKKSK